MKGVVFRCCVVYALQIINVTTTYNFFLKKRQVRARKADDSVV